MKEKGSGPAAGPARGRPEYSPPAAQHAVSPASSRLEVLDRISTGSFSATGRSLGLTLAPGADRVRAPPPPSMAGGFGGGLQGGHGHGSNTPAHRGGVDINFLRTHDVSL